MYSPQNQPVESQPQSYVREDFSPQYNAQYKKSTTSHKTQNGKEQNSLEAVNFLRRLQLFLYWFRPFNLLRFLGLPIISRYIVAEFLFSFVISFAFFFFIFLVNALLLVARKYAGEGLPLWAILRLIYYNIPTNVSLSLPFSVLVGALMAISHLAASNQMLAFRTCSVRRANILVPLLVCSFITAIGSFIFSDYFLPLGRINTKKIILQLLSNNPKVIINPYSVRSFRSDNGRNTYIISGTVNDEIINDLIIVDYDQDLNRRIFFAKKARLAEERPSGVVPFILDDVTTTIASNLEPQKYSYMSASSVLYNVLLGDVTETYNLTPNDRQSWELIRSIREIEQEEQDLRNNYDVRTLEYQMHYRSSYKSFYMTTDESLTKSHLKSAQNSAVNRPSNLYDGKVFSYKMALYLRLAIPFSCIPFMVLAFSLGSLAKRYGRSIGFLLGLVLSGIFWSSLAGGRLLGRSNSLEIPPFLLMFASNIIFLILGALLLLRQKT